MLVTVRLFARLREIAGSAEMTRELPDRATAQTAWEALVADCPALGQYDRAVSCAVNDEYAQFTTPLHDGDDVAFLPPVSGGSAACGRRPLQSERGWAASAKAPASSAEAFAKARPREPLSKDIIHA